MALTDEQRGPRAAWLFRHRKALYGAGDGGLAKLADDLGKVDLYRAPDTIKGWEASETRAPIPAEVLPALEGLFGEKAPAPHRAVTAEELVAALDRQTEAINDLVDRLDTFVGPLGELTAELLREQLAARGRRRSGVGAS